MERLISFRRFTCPSTAPLLHGSPMAAWTAASSCRSPATKPPSSLAAAAYSHGFNAAGSRARRIAPKPRTCSAAACSLGARPHSAAIAAIRGRKAGRIAYQAPRDSACRRDAGRGRSGWKVPAPSLRPALDDLVAALEADGAKLAIQARRVVLTVLPARLDKAQISIEPAWGRCPAIGHKRPHAQPASYAVAGGAERARDRLDRHALTVQA